MSGFVYGPVNSRRLGRSLGVDLLEPKSCTENCIYCQLGAAEPLPPKRKRFVCPETIEKDLEIALESKKQIDFVTLSGSGEPTLSSDLGRIVHCAKNLIDKIYVQQKPHICVLTNGTLLSDKGVREELSYADLVIPNLDSGDEETFRKINRPNEEIDFEKYVNGLIKFNESFNGNFFLEIVLVKGINDAEEYLKKISALVSKIKPDGVWLGTISRPPAEKWAKPVDEEILEKAKNIIGANARIIEKFHGDNADFPSPIIIEEILNILSRRPETARNIAVSLRANLNEVLKSLYSSNEKGIVEPTEIGGESFWRIKK